MQLGPQFPQEKDIGDKMKNATCPMSKCFWDSRESLKQDVLKRFLGLLTERGKKLAEKGLYEAQ